MIHTEAFESNDYIYEVDSLALFEEVKAEGVPFHMWYKWLETKFSDRQKEITAKTEAATEKSKKSQEVSQSGSIASSAFGVFDKFYKFVTRESEEERLERERKERKLLYGGSGRRPQKGT